MLPGSRIRTRRKVSQAVIKLPDKKATYETKGFSVYNSRGQSIKAETGSCITYRQEQRTVKSGCSLSCLVVLSLVALLKYSSRLTSALGMVMPTVAWVSHMSQVSQSPTDTCIAQSNVDISH